MNYLDRFLNKIDAVALMRISLGIIFLWFGVLKIFGMSPVEDMIASSFDFMGKNFIPILGVIEVVIGLGFLFKKFLRFVLILFFFQMLGTFSTLLFNPGLLFDAANPLLLTMEGEFLVKNLLLITAGIVIWKSEARLDI